MAPGFLVHQRKRFRRRRSLIVFGPAPISVIVKNAGEAIGLNRRASALLDQLFHFHGDRAQDFGFTALEQSAQRSE